MGDVAAGISSRQVEVTRWPEICLAVGREFLLRRDATAHMLHNIQPVRLEDFCGRGIVRNKKFDVMKWCTGLAGLMPGEHDNG